MIEMNDRDDDRWAEREGRTYFPSHPPRAQILPESWIAMDAFPGCFVRAIVQDASTSVGAFYAPRSMNAYNHICAMAYI